MANVEGREPASSPLTSSFVLKPSLIEDTKAFLQAGLPWQWLTTQLASLIQLSWQDKAFLADTAKAHTQTSSAQETAVQETECRIQWDPKSFLAKQYAPDALPQLDDVFTITG